MTRSVRIHEFGGPQVLRIEDVAIQEPEAGEVRLRVHAIGMNRTEVTLRSGRLPVKPTLPTAIGFEAAGVIVGANLVFDPVGGAGFSLLAQSTASGGTLVLYGALDFRPAQIPSFDVFARDLTIRGVALPALARDDHKLAAMKTFVSEGLSTGALRPTIARTFAFDDIADAHRFVEAGEQIGKIVVTV
jgi:NADPH:quinone reductase-like Zn-dependent oxidoreductase